VVNLWASSLLVCVCVYVWCVCVCVCLCDSRQTVCVFFACPKRMFYFSVGLFLLFCFFFVVFFFFFFFFFHFFVSLIEYIFCGYRSFFCVSFPPRCLRFVAVYLLFFLSLCFSLLSVFLSLSSLTREKHRK